MQTNVVNLSGKVLRTIDLDDRVFGIEPNQAVVHQAVVTQQANARQGTHDTKTRAEVAGGGKKPYRQKGTGYARQGSTRAPHYRKGGVVFGPHPRSYEKALPRKMRRLAMRSVLSARAADELLTVVDAFEIQAGRTKLLLEALGGLSAGDGALVVLGERSDALLRAARNLDKVHVVTPNGLNLLDMLRLPRMIVTESAVQELTRTLTSDLRPTGEVAGSESRVADSEPEAAPVSGAPPQPRRTRKAASAEETTPQPETRNPQPDEDTPE
jgi:large subunit ribosomal protein L4